MTTDEAITLDLTSEQLRNLANAVALSAKAKYGVDSVTVTFSREQFTLLGGQLRNAGFIMADMGQREMADEVAELLSYIEGWPDKPSEDNPASTD
jgi:hypothetical protein